MDTTHVVDRLRAFARAKGWNKWEFARQAGLRDTVLRRFNDDDWNPTVETLRKLEAQLPEGWQLDDPVPPDSPDQPPRPRVVPASDVSPDAAAELGTAATQLTTEGGRAGDEARADLAPRRSA